jgi:hypothetical protein
MSGENPSFADSDSLGDTGFKRFMFLDAIGFALRESHLF